MNYLEEIELYLQQGRASKIKALIAEAMEQQIPANKILLHALMPAMASIGRNFRDNKVFVPEVLIAGKAMNVALDLLRPSLVKEDLPKIGKVVLGTVKGDLHDIGKNLVKIMMQGKGLEVFDLGVDVEAQSFVDEAERVGAEVIACSALLTTTMHEMKQIVRLAKEKDKKVIIGGAPVSEKYRQHIGADFYAGDAAESAELIAGYYNSKNTSASITKKNRMKDSADKSAE
ncbi:B12-binding domain-containing protein [Acetivibrio sp. MSJd-27]|uniref:cobalamin B12-binding domain-containing protein n=1 Tax=Acetivibrio sp. MSJd-27 TaxID=2841523 RepID=UPI001C106317|nr:cobalamin-dependent protein [Acetivibrio sp. MSJd-27]MBU5451458.1 cobalamin-dependent protein [Acetivibrio sp. MSJd-27]